MTRAYVETAVIPIARHRSAELPAFAFGRFVLIPALFELRAGVERVPVAPKVFDVIALLVAHHRRVVTHAELKATVWPGVAVTAGSITFAVREARALLGDDGRRQAVIRNVRSRGYRFVAVVSEVAA